MPDSSPVERLKAAARPDAAGPAAPVAASRALGASGGWLPALAVGGVSLRFHSLAFATPAVLALTAPGGAEALFRLGAWAVVLASLLLHEIGHAAAARFRGLPVGGVFVQAWGAWVLCAAGGPGRRAALDEAVVAVAGPLANLLAAAGVAVVLALAGAWPESFQGAWRGDLRVVALGANLAMAALNLAPVFPADGGRLLRALLALPLGYARATRAALATSLAAAAVLVAWGVVAGTPWMAALACAAAALLLWRVWIERSRLVGLTGRPE